MGSTGIIMIGIRKARRYQRGISEDVHRRTAYTMFKRERTKRIEGQNIQCKEKGLRDRQ
jgi:hypothetical protein